MDLQSESHSMLNTEGLAISKQWNVPPRNLYFTGRDELLEQLASSLKPSEANITVVSACQGMGGVGKTQLAIEYAHRHKNDYTYIFWFMANQMELEYSRIAHLLNIDTQQPLDDIVEQVKAWLDRHPGGLLVYDNASNPEALKGYLPTMETSSILVTSRATQWHSLGESVTVEVFTAEEARTYFQGLLGDLFESSSLETLADTLEYSPLALAQSGAYMKKNKVSPSKYLVLYESEKKMLWENTTMPPDYHHEAVFITWDITMQAIQKESQLALALLTLCACLSSTDIPHFLLDKWAEKDSRNPDHEVIEEALRVLRDYWMLTINSESESVSIHCLVQEAIQLKWTTGEKRNNLLSVIVFTTNLIKLSHQDESQKDYNIIQRLIPHLEVLQHSFDEWLATSGGDINDLYLKTIYTCLGNGYHIFRIATKQRDLQEHALVIMEEHYGSDHPEVAAALDSLANAYGDLGETAKQRDLLERALVIDEKHNGPDHPDVASTLNNLGNAYGSLGEFEKRRELQERALSILEKHYGADHPQMARALSNLGNAYGFLGVFTKQRELLERALPIKETHYGPDHPDVAETLVNLGNAHGQLGEYAKQRELLERALPMLEKHYSPDHPHVAGTLHDLGNAHGQLGEYAIKRDLLERALPILKKHLDPDHPQVAASLVNLGNAYGFLGEFEKQRELQECALPILEKHYGADHPQMARALSNLGNAYGSLGVFTKQRELLERALLMKEKHYGPDHPDVAGTLVNLGIAYGKLGEYAKQRELLERALPMLEKHYGPDHPQVAASLVNLGNAYGSLGEYAIKRDLLERALPILKKHLDPDHPHVAKTVYNLSRTYESLGE